MIPTEAAFQAIIAANQLDVIAHQPEVAADDPRLSAAVELMIGTPDDVVVNRRLTLAYESIVEAVQADYYLTDAQMQAALNICEFKLCELAET